MPESSSSETELLGPIMDSAYTVKEAIMAPENAASGTKIALTTPSEMMRAAPNPAPLDAPST